LATPASLAMPAVGALRPFETMMRVAASKMAVRFSSLRGLGMDSIFDGKWKVNVRCNLGYGDQTKLFPRDPRLNFEEASVIL
jgi:hypothetical protein